MEKNKKIRTFISILLILAYSSYLIWIGYRPFQRNIIDPGYQYYFLRTMVDDQPIFSNPDFDDSKWSSELKGHRGTWWLRAKVYIKDSLKPFKKRGISIMIKGSYELYFSGVLIGKNGKINAVGNEEEIGYYRQTFVIPDTLVSDFGYYPIALRIANETATHAQLPYIRIGEYLELARNPLSLALFLHILAGIFLIAGFYFGGIFLIYFRQKDLFIFSILCFCFFGLTILEYAKYYVDYLHTWQVYRLVIIQILSLIVAFLLPSYFMFHFKIAHKWVILGIHLTILLLIQFNVSGFDKPAYFMVLAAFISSLGIILLAWIHDKKYSNQAIVSVLLFSVCFIIYYDFILFVGFLAIVGFAIFALNRHIKLQKQLYEASLIKASRLEIELLKKKIQPHFLMNTLTSLINMVEEQPAVGVKMIHSLARLFKMMDEISSHPLIPLQQEIELCRIHLEMMEYQREIQYDLICSEFPNSEQIPPAILLTLVENGITHQKPINGKMSFQFQFIEHAGEKVYKIKSKGKLRLSKRKNSNGIGLQYIKARLDEWANNHWSLEIKEEKDIFCTQIKIKKA